MNGWIHFYRIAPGSPGIRRQRADRTPFLTLRLERGDTGTLEAYMNYNKLAWQLVDMSRALDEGEYPKELGCGCWRPAGRPRGEYGLVVEHKDVSKDDLRELRALLASRAL